jgi:hypothetical protein
MFSSGASLSRATVSEYECFMRLMISSHLKDGSGRTPLDKWISGFLVGVRCGLEWVRYTSRCTFVAPFLL